MMQHKLDLPPRLAKLIVSFFFVADDQTIINISSSTSPFFQYIWTSANSTLSNSSRMSHKEADEHHLHK